MSKNEIDETLNEEAKDVATEENQDKTQKEPISEVDRLQEEKAQLHDKYVRLFAEFDNYKRRTAKERLVLIETANRKLMTDILPILDDFERALIYENEHVTKEEEGLILIYNKFKKMLELKGLKRMQSKGEVFDADLHEGITEIEAPKEELKGCVVDVLEEGYFLHDTIIRYAKVVIGK